MEEKDTFGGYLEKIIYMQRMDIIIYDSVNFDDLESTLSYFKQLYQHYSGKSEEEVDHMFEILFQSYKHKTDQGSKTPFEDLAQLIMRSAAEKIHITFHNYDRLSYAKTFTSLSLEMNHALIELWTLLVKDLKEDNSS